MRRVRLGDVCRIVSGSTPKSGNPDFWGGAIPWVTPAELDDESHWVFRTDRYLTETGFDSASLHMMPIGTVLLSTRAPIGKTAIAGVEMCCNQGFKNLVCGDEIDCEYLYRFLKSNTSMLQALGRGATFKELSKREIERFEIPLPPLERQRECTSRLDAIDNEIARARTLSMALDELVKSRFVEMFGIPIEPHDSWAFDRIDAFCDVITGNTPSRKRPEFYGDYLEWIKTDNITDAAYLTEASEKLSELGTGAGRIAPAGSVLMACIAGSVKSIGKVAIADRSVAFNQQINALVPHEGTIETEYLLWMLRLSKEYLCSDINMQLKGILNKSNLSKKAFSVPPLSLQQEFAAFVQQVDKLKFETQQAIDKLQMLYDSLAQEYFATD